MLWQKKIKSFRSDALLEVQKLLLPPNFYCYLNNCASHHTFWYVDIYMLKKHFIEKMFLIWKIADESAQYLILLFQWTPSFSIFNIFYRRNKWIINDNISAIISCPRSGSLTIHNNFMRRFCVFPCLHFGIKINF